MDDVDFDSPEAFARALDVVHLAHAAVSSEAFEGFAPGARGYQVLAAIARRRPSSQAALAAHLHIDRTAMVYLLDDMQAANFVRRSVDPVDRRAHVLSLTARGHRKLTTLDARLRSAEHELLARIGEDNGRTVKRLVFDLAVAITAFHAASSDED